MGKVIDKSGVFSMIASRNHARAAVRASLRGPIEDAIRRVEAAKARERAQRASPSAAIPESE